MGRAIALLTAATAVLCIAAAAAQSTTPAPADQKAQYESGGPKSVVELQQFRRTDMAAVSGAGGRRGMATLVNLNPRANAWFLLTLQWAGGQPISYHLESPAPRQRHLTLDGGSAALRLPDGGTCAPWSGEPSELDGAQRVGLPFAPLCGGRLFLRNAASGHRTNLERVTDFLRDHVWRGEAIVRFVREEFYRDSFAETSRPETAAQTAGAGQPSGAPAPAEIDPAFAGRTVAPGSLGIRVDGAPSRQLALGGWYRASGLSGVYVSAIEPQAVARSVLESHPARVNPLDSVEGAALTYLIAFDLGAFDLGFAMGTDHPRVDWSPRPPVSKDGLPGPDGFATIAPLVNTGMLTPALSGRVVATFTGGFRRSHGAFKYGDLATRNRGSHYGFVEQGVVLSKLQPGLATLVVLDDGTVEMKTWTAADDERLGRVVFARQNGVPLVERDVQSGAPVPGALVNRWGPGNWSGSADMDLRTLRAGACLAEAEGRRFLIYAYFSTATPSAMARVFQAYNCGYAMLLDMNALEHTYLAAYPRRGDTVVVEHLVTGMAQIDKTERGQLIPRFIGFPDNRDFFYVLRRERP